LNMYPDAANVSLPRNTCIYAGALAGFVEGIPGIGDGYARIEDVISEADVRVAGTPCDSQTVTGSSISDSRTFKAVTEVWAGGLIGRAYSNTRVNYVIACGDVKNTIPAFLWKDGERDPRPDGQGRYIAVTSYSGGIAGFTGGPNKTSEEINALGGWNFCNAQYGKIDNAAALMGSVGSVPASTYEEVDDLSTAWTLAVDLESHPTERRIAGIVSYYVNPWPTEKSYPPPSPQPPDYYDGLIGSLCYAYNNMIVENSSASVTGNGKAITVSAVDEVFFTTLGFFGDNRPWEWDAENTVKNSADKTFIVPKLK